MIDPSQLIPMGLGGGVGVALAAAFNFLRSRTSREIASIRAVVEADRLALERENKLWAEIGTLRGQLTVMQSEILDLRKDRHAMREQLQREVLINHMLRLEVNALLKDQGRKPKYDIEAALREQPDAEGTADIDRTQAPA